MNDLNLNTLLQEMRAIATQMVPFSYPRVPAENEECVYPLRIREAIVDGYPVVIYYGIADHGHHTLETVQVFSRHGIFLPFSLVVKVGRMFLGGYNLSLMEMFRERRKIYCWTVYRDRKGNPGKTPFKMPSERCVFEGFEYDYMTPQCAK